MNGTTNEKTENDDNFIINVEHLSKQFFVDKQPMEVLRDINLKVKKGEFITIVGHSGCGKSTLLKIMCGLVDYETGTVERNGHAVEGPGPNCGMVFQDHRLLPWLKIKDNVGFGAARDLESGKRREGQKASGTGRTKRICKQLSESAVGRNVTAGGDRAGACEQSDDPAFG